MSRIAAVAKMLQRIFLLRLVSLKEPHSMHFLSVLEI
ncbi:MAG: hypothetical protein JWR69_2236, partial [Pedosphaera sp.]|nr:hypothetical protein [Pedosphaera sp.]